MPSASGSSALRLLDVGHQHWLLAPQLSFADPVAGESSGKSPEWAMTGFTSNAQGFFSAGYRRTSPAELVLAVKAPQPTVGRVGLPTLNTTVVKVEQDGVKLALDLLKKYGAYLFVSNVKGGNRSFIIRYVV